VVLVGDIALDVVDWVVEVPICGEADGKLSMQRWVWWEVVECGRGCWPQCP